MTFAQDKNSSYNFTCDIYLLKEVIKNKDSNLHEIYGNAIDEINTFLEGKINFYGISIRTYDMVSAALKHKHEFTNLGTKSPLIVLLEVLEKENGKDKFSFM